MHQESDTFPSESVMEMPKRLLDCLNQNKVQYEVLHHPEAVTAQRIAQAEHVKGGHHAKVVMIKSGDQHLMMVLPADHQIDLEKVEKAIGSGVSLDKEQELKSLFPDCITGAMPPFGNLYGLPTYVDKNLAERDYIVFEAGTHTAAIKISYREARSERAGDQASADERSLTLRTINRRAAEDGQGWRAELCHAWRNNRRVEFR
jgi:Ala-tRNA(Pro) deacylase